MVHRAQKRTTGQSQVQVAQKWRTEEQSRKKTGGKAGKGGQRPRPWGIMDDFACAPLVLSPASEAAALKVEASPGARLRPGQASSQLQHTCVSLQMRTHLAALAAPVRGARHLQFRGRAGWGATTGGMQGPILAATLGFLKPQTSLGALVLRRAGAVGSITMCFCAYADAGADVLATSTAVAAAAGS
jgi:hypothetical protein